jgi:hypothetical protein
MSDQYDQQTAEELSEEAAKTHEKTRDPVYQMKKYLEDMNHEDTVYYTNDESTILDLMANGLQPNKIDNAAARRQCQKTMDQEELYQGEDDQIDDGVLEWFSQQPIEKQTEYIESILKDSELDEITENSELDEVTENFKLVQLVPKFQEIQKKTRVNMSCLNPTAPEFVPFSSQVINKTDQYGQMDQYYPIQDSTDQYYQIQDSPDQYGQTDEFQTDQYYPIQDSTNQYHPIQDKRSLLNSGSHALQLTNHHSVTQYSMIPLKQGGYPTQPYPIGQMVEYLPGQYPPRLPPAHQMYQGNSMNPVPQNLGIKKGVQSKSKAIQPRISLPRPIPQLRSVSELGTLQNQTSNPGASSNSNVPRWIQMQKLVFESRSERVKQDCLRVSEQIRKNIEKF